MKTSLLQKLLKSLPAAFTLVLISLVFFSDQAFSQNNLLTARDIFVDTKNVSGSIMTSVFVTSTVRSEYTIIYTLYSREDELIFSKRNSFSLPLGNGTVNYGLDVKFPKLWTPETPYLYSLKIEAYHHDALQFSKTVRFGIRTISVSGTKILLNEIPVFLAGCGIENKNGQLPDTPEKCSVLFNNAKKLGFNFIRFKNFVPPDFALDLADELGILVQPEIGINLNSNLRGYDEISKNAEDVRAKIYRLKKHPSVIIYCYGNEIHNISQLPWHSHLYEAIKGIDSTRIILDNSGWGEFDRDYSDIHAQHFGYFFPYGEFKNIYRDKRIFLVDGSANNIPKEELLKQIESNSLKINKPVIAHEICNFPTFPDLRKKSIPEIEQKIEKNGLQGVLPDLVSSSRRFMARAHKINIEAIRRSNMISGYQVWLLSDHPAIFSGIMENPSLDIKESFNPDYFTTFNNQTVLLSDFDKQVCYEGNTVKVHLFLSVYNQKTLSGGVVKWRLYKDDTEFYSGAIDSVSINNYGLNDIGEVSIEMPRLLIPQQVTFQAEFSGGEIFCKNEWKIWIFPKNRLLQQQGRRIDADIPYQISMLYPFFNKPSLKNKPDLLITRKLNQNVFNYLDDEGTVLFLYNPVIESPRNIYFPFVKSKYRPAVYSWGNNIGMLLKNHPVLSQFPQEGYEDIQFFRLLEDGVKIILNGFPVEVDPIIRPIDAPWSSRKFGSLFELKAGKGKILICSLNFSGLDRDQPEVIYFFDKLLRYTFSDSFKPQTEIELSQFINATVGIGRYGAMFDYEAPWWEKDRFQKREWDSILNK